MLRTASEKHRIGFMPILHRGFLGKEAENKRGEIRAGYAKVFDTLEEVNILGHEYLRKLQLGSRNEPNVWSAAYFIRGLECFQSIVILSERGLVHDGAALCRTLLQVHFRSAAIAEDRKVIARLKASALSYQKQRAKDFQSGKLRIPPNVADVDWSAKLVEIEASLEQSGRSEANDWELFTLGNCDRRDYNAYLLFSDAAHVSATELQKIIKIDANGHFSGVTYGPHDRNLAAFASYAAQILIEILQNTEKVMQVGLPIGLPDLSDRVTKLL
jgi:hypothetical protein